MTTEELVARFNETLGQEFNTRLIGGFDEPWYRASTDNRPHEIHFRQDFIRSALHEIAHWCIAGEERRQVDDYGYWYETETRDASAQALFEQVEAKPQALEKLFCEALGLSFGVSSDNLALDSQRHGFARRVDQLAEDMLHGRQPLPTRGREWLALLAQ